MAQCLRTGDPQEKPRCVGRASPGVKARKRFKLRIGEEVEKEYRKCTHFRAGAVLHSPVLFGHTAGAQRTEKNWSRIRMKVVAN